MDTKERIARVIQYFKQHQDRHESMKIINVIQGDDGLFPFAGDRFSEEQLSLLAKIFKWRGVFIMHPGLIKRPKVGLDLVRAQQRKEKNPYVKLYDWVRPGKELPDETNE